MRNHFFAYIDPGTGAMLFSVIIGVVSAVFFFFQKILLGIKFLLSGGRVDNAYKDRHAFVIFAESKRYALMFKPICDEFEKRKINCEYYTSSMDDPMLDEQYEYVHPQFIGEGNKAYAKLNVMNADICLTTTPGLDVYQWKRSKNVKWYVHTLHEVGGVAEYRMFGIDYFDAILLSGEFQKEPVRQLEKLRGINEKELVVTGAVFMDSLSQRVAKLGINNSDLSETTILVAPSWGESSILNRYGQRLLDELAKTGYKIIIRPHPQSEIAEPELLKKLRERYPDSDMISWDRDSDNMKSLSKASLLITDFSGIIFDYAMIFNRPVLYATADFDSSPYDSAWIDEPMWRYKVLPQIGRELIEDEFFDIKSIIDDMLSDDSAADTRQEICKEAWMYKGEAAVRIVDYLVKKQEELV